MTCVKSRDRAVKLDPKYATAYNNRGNSYSSVGFHPWEGLRLQLGVGHKDPSGKQENVLRTGITYDWEFAPTWFLKPYFALDFIENEEVFGFYFGKLF